MNIKKIEKNKYGFIYIDGIYIKFNGNFSVVIDEYESIEKTLEMKGIIKENCYEKDCICRYEKYKKMNLCDYISMIDDHILWKEHCKDKESIKHAKKAKSYYTNWNKISNKLEIIKNKYIFRYKDLTLYVINNERNIINDNDNIDIIIIDFEKKLNKKINNIKSNVFSTDIKNKREVITEEVRHEVWRRDQGKCVICGSNRNLEYDHILPFSKGGSNTARNIQILCETCNRRKSNNI